jgi:hypothetical protein
MTRAAVCLVMLTLPARLWAADEGIVEATGEATIGADQVEAKRAATLDALRRAVEKVVGIYIESDFSATQREVVRGNESSFSARVQDEVVQKAKGFIERYDVLAEKQEGDRYQVTVRAHVFASKLKAELESLANLIAAAGNPKLMMVVQEVIVRNGKTSVSHSALIASALQSRLLAMGFEFRGKAEAASTADNSLEAFDRWRADVGGLAKMARDAGADILIEGRVEIKDLGKITRDMAGGLDSLVGMTKIEIHGNLRGVNAATGEVIAGQPILHKEMGTDFDRAVHRALRGSTGKRRKWNVIDTTFDELLADARRSFQKTAERGQGYEVRLGNVTSFRRQVGPFLRSLEGIAGVTSVRQKSFRGGLLVVDLECKCSTAELQNRIFAACAPQAALTDIDLDRVSGKRLNFRL